MATQPCVRVIFPDGEPAFELVGYDIGRIPDIAIGSCWCPPWEVVVCTADSQKVWKWEHDRDYEPTLTHAAGLWWICSQGHDQEFVLSDDDYDTVQELAWPRVKIQDEASNAL